MDGTPGGARAGGRGDRLYSAYVSPGIGLAYLAYRSGAAEIYGAFADAEGKLDLYWFNRTTLRWVKTDRLDTRPGPVEGRPALQWIPTAAGSTTPGRLELAFLAHNTTDPVKRQPNRMTSYTKLDAATNSLVERIGLQGPHDNVWLYARGIDFLYDAGIDTNLRAAITYGSNHGEDDPTQPKDYQVWFRPAADGVIDFTYKPFDDWQVLRYGVCRHVVDPANTTRMRPRSSARRRPGSTAGGGTSSSVGAAPSASTDNLSSRSTASERTRHAGSHRHHRGL